MFKGYQETKVQTILQELYCFFNDYGRSLFLLLMIPPLHSKIK